MGMDYHLNIYFDKKPDFKKAIDFFIMKGIHKVLLRKESLKDGILKGEYVNLSAKEAASLLANKGSVVLWDKENVQISLSHHVENHISLGIEDIFIERADVHKTKNLERRRLVRKFFSFIKANFGVKKFKEGMGYHEEYQVVNEEDNWGGLGE